MRQILFLCFALLTLSARAQFFWGFPRQPQVEQPRERYTAPQFKGGKAAVEAFISKHFQQPSERVRVDGKIVVAVIVDAKGKPAEVQVVRQVERALDAEARRVCQKMKFRPATVGKKRVKGRIDITFPVRHGRVTFVDLPTVEV